jgi:TRAP-type uncharacterized transport system substrate-binding protein
MTILVTPELDVPPPFRMTAEELGDLRDRAARAFNTVEFLRANGLEEEALVPQEIDRREARAVFNDSPVHTFTNTIDTPAKAVMLQALLNEYDIDVVRNAQQVRNYVKLKLLELTNSGNDKTELKALELLGKMSDVQAFAERVEVSVTHRTTEELEEELASKLVKYMGEVIDVTDNPVDDNKQLENAPAVDYIDLDEELGLVEDMDDDEEPRE